MDEGKGKGMKIVIYLLSILVVVGLFVVGFIWFFGEDEQSESEEPSNDLEYVEVIEDEEEEEVVAEESDEPETEVTEPTSEEAEKPATEGDAETPTEETATETPAGAKTVGTATSAEGANVIGYSYEVANGKFLFEWKVKANGDQYPKAVASVVDKTQIKVVYESLQKDYVAKEETTTQLGSQLPELVWKPTATGSEYLFKYTAEKAFELKTVDRGEEGKFVVLEVAF